MLLFPLNMSYNAVKSTTTLFIATLRTFSLHLKVLLDLRSDLFSFGFVSIRSCWFADMEYFSYVGESFLNIRVILGTDLLELNCT